MLLIRSRNLFISPAGVVFEFFAILQISTSHCDSLTILALAPSCATIRPFLVPPSVPKGWSRGGMGWIGMENKA